MAEQSCRVCAFRAHTRCVAPANAHVRVHVHLAMGAHCIHFQASEGITVRPARPLPGDAARTHEEARTDERRRRRERAE